jgi:hypothetical protein
VVAISSVSSAAASAVHFDGTNDYITFGNPTELGLPAFTIETWFMRDGAGAATTTSGSGGGGFVGAATDGIIPLIAKGRGEADGDTRDMNYILGITTGSAIGTHIGADFEEGATANPGLNHRVIGAATIQNGVWYHAAATYDGVDFKLYLNGVLDGQVLGINRTPQSSSIQHASLGSALTSTGAAGGFFAGAIDEARVWNYARSEADIAATMSVELTTDPGEPGGQLVARWGLEEGAGTSAADSILPSSTGTLTNGPTWVNGFNYVEPVPNPGPYSVVFNGTDTSIRVPDSNTLDAPNFTVEAWVNRSSGGVATGTGTGGITAYPVISKGRAEAETNDADVNYFLGIDTSGRIAVDFEQANSGANHPLTGAAVVPVGEWHHIAATYDGSTWNTYLDGQPDASLAVGQPANSTNLAPVGIGRAFTTGLVAAGAFSGSIDEARVWNVARTPAQIAASFTHEITSATPGLVARWGMNEDSGAGVPDSIGTNDGTLANGTRGPGFVAPAPGNVAPDAPVLVSPGDASTGVSTSPNLVVTATDPDGGTVGVSFYGRPLASGNFTLIGTDPDVPSGGDATINWPSLGDGQTFEWYASVSDGEFTTEGPTATFHTALGSDPVFVGVGDIASCSTTGDELVAEVMEGLDGPIFTTGDNVYPNGTATDFTNCYDPAWGQFNPRVRPVPGNHDWGTGVTNNLDGYFGYFGAQATDANGQSYYSYDIDSNWHVVNLDSECALVPGGCGAGSAQEQWLAADLAANAGKNMIAIWHKPRFGSGATNLTALQPLVDDLYAAGVDITLAGHDHIYERLAPIDANGNLDATYGMRHFTVGTGGEAHHGAGTPIAASEALDDNTFGVIKFNLHPTSYEWEFLPIAGQTFADSGSDVVRPAPPGPGATAIDLGSAGAYVPFGDPAKLDLAQFTVETWFKRTGAGVSGTTGTGGIPNFVPLVTHGAPEADNSNVDANWLLGINDATDVLAADFEEGVGGASPGLNHPIFGTTPIANDVWHHAAVTYDGATWNLYLDGTLEATQAVNQPVRSDTIQHAALGAMLKSDGAPANTARFAGVLDESRVWNRALSLVEIEAAVNLELTSGSGLVARWGMNDGVGSQITDSVSPVANGTISGSGSAWVPGAPFDIVISQNQPPDTPVLVAPSDGSVGVSTTAELQVGVDDPDGDQVTTTFYGRPAGAPPGEDFTIVVLPDTQHYVDTNEANADTFRAQTQWIVDNQNALNVVFVSHLGDIAENFDTVEVEWQRADSAMDTLDNAGIPNNVAPGNHDMSNPGAVTSNYFDQYFPPSRYDLPQNPWYGGWLGEELGQTQRLNKDNYELFTAGGIDFLIIHLEIDMPTYAVAWANDIIGRYPDRQVIISTHAFLNSSASRPSGTITGRANGLSASQVWDQLIFPNCNVFLVVNGHYPGESNTATNNSCGRPVQQALTDYQSRANGGDGWLRYYTFRPATNEIDAVTYSPTLASFETDANSQFTMTYDMTDLGGFVEIGSTTTPSGGTASVSWSGRAPNTQYEWYAVADDGAATVVSPTWSFTTGAAPAVPNWSAYVDLRSSVGDQNAANVVAIPEGPADVPINPATSFDLIDLASGSTVGATLQVDNSGINTTSDNGADFSAGPAFDVFDGIVDAQGVYSFNEVSDVWQINISGLDPSKRYEVVTSSNRDQVASPERWTQVELLGAVASTEASGGSTTVVSPTLVRLETQNNTARGDVAKWTGIDPGSDGSISLRSDLYLVTGTDRSYAPVLLRLREFDAESTDVTPPSITLVGDAEVTIVAGSVYVDAGATALDDVDGDLSGDIVIVNPVDGNVPGNYTITYNVADAAGNNADEVTRLVHVVAADSISGYVLNGSEPAEGVCVLIYDTSGTGYVGGFACAGADGSYVLDVSSLPVDDYVLRPYDPNARWGAATPFSAVHAGAGLGAYADVPVLAAAQIGGKVTDAESGAGIGTVCIYLYHAIDDSPAPVATCARADGVWALDGLPEGMYKVGISDVTPAHQTWWSGNAPDLASATPVMISNGTVAVVDAAMTPLPGVELYVYDASHTPIAGVCMYLYDEDPAVSFADYGTCSDANGRLAVYTAPGVYRAAVADPAGVYETGWFGGSSWADADDIDNQDFAFLSVGEITLTTVSG